MGKEKGSRDLTAALPFSASLTNTKGLRALSPFYRQGNTEVRVGHSQEGWRQSSPPAAGPAGSTACATQGYLRQCFRDTEISIGRNHGFPRIKRRKQKMFPIPQASNFSHTTLTGFQPQGCSVARYSPAQIQVNSTDMAKRSSAARDIHSILRDLH